MLLFAWRCSGRARVALAILGLLFCRCGVYIAAHATLRAQYVWPRGGGGNEFIRRLAFWRQASAQDSGVCQILSLEEEDSSKPATASLSSMDCKAPFLASTAYVNMALAHTFDMTKDIPAQARKPTARLPEWPPLRVRGRLR